MEQFCLLKDTKNVIIYILKRVILYSPSFSNILIILSINHSLTNNNSSI